MALRPSTHTHSRLWQSLASHDWFLISVLSFLEHDDNDVHCLYLLAIEDDDDDSGELRTQLEVHCALSVKHARDLAMLHSCWTALLKLPAAKRASNVGDPRFHETTVNTIVEELTRLNLAPRCRADRHQDRYLALMTAVGSVAHTIKIPYYYDGCGLYKTAGIADPPASYCMTSAARGGDLESVVWLHYFAKYDQGTVLKEAATQGHADVVAWLLAHVDNGITVEFQEWDEPALGVMVWRRYGTVRYTMTRKWGFSIAYSNESSAVSLAAAAGDLNAVQRMFAHPYFKASFTCPVAIAAVSSGHLPLLQFLFDHCPEVFKQSGSMRPAVENGHVEVVQWMIHHGVGDPIESWAFQTAMRQGHVELLQWMMDSTDGASAIVDRLLSWASHVVVNGETLRWLVRERGFQVARTNARAAIVARCDTALVQWIVCDLIVRGDCTPIDGETLLEDAIKSGDHELVRWFIDEHGLWSHDAFQLASLGSSTETLAFVYDTARRRVLFGMATPLVPGYREQLTTNGDSLQTLEWLLHHGFREGFLHPYALTDLKSTVNDCAYLRHRLMLSGFISEDEKFGFLAYRRVVGLLIQFYDPAYLRAVTWLPRWAAQHGQLHLLQRLAQIHHPRVYGWKRLKDFPYQVYREPILKWYLQERLPVEKRSTLVQVVYWSVPQSSMALLQWLFQAFLPTLDATTDGSSLLRKCVQTAMRSAVQNHRQEVLWKLPSWTTIASDPAMQHTIDFEP